MLVSGVLVIRNYKVLKPQTEFELPQTETCNELNGKNDELFLQETVVGGYLGKDFLVPCSALPRGFVRRGMNGMKREMRRKV